MRSLITLLLVAVLVAIQAALAIPAAAQGDPDGWTLYDLNLRAGPDTAHAVLTVLPANTDLIIEARTEDLAWLLARTMDGAWRGWVASLYLRYQDGFAAARLPVSGEVIAAPVGESAPDGEPDGSAGIPVGVGPLYEFLQSVPVIPAISARAAALAAGGNARRFTKAGDCNSQAWDYLGPFDTGQYDLGDYGALQSAIDFFRGSFGDESPAARVGFSALTMVDGTWADPNLCDPGETPFWCALRTSEAGIVLLSFGPNDVRNLTPEQFSGSVRKMVYWAIQFGALPVLSTFPWCGTLLADKALMFNAEIVAIAREYDVPVINFWKASLGVQNCGLAADGVHLSTAGPPYGAYFTGDQGTSGHTLRNLLTLQTLDAIRAAVG